MPPIPVPNQSLSCEFIIQKLFYGRFLSLKRMEEILNSYAEEESSSLRSCQVCDEGTAIYKCPKCSLFTCSLPCVRTHKVNTKCSGVRDRTEFVPIQSFTDKNLRQDFHFLEDVLQSKRIAKRLLASNEASGSSTRRNNNKHRKKDGLKVISRQNLDGHSQQVRKLVNEVKRYDLSAYKSQLMVICLKAQALQITLMVMPEGMARRKANTTRLNHKTLKIEWRLHFLFLLKPNASVLSLLQYDYLKASANASLIENSYLSYFAAGVNSDDTLISCLENLMNPALVYNIILAGA